MKTKKLHCVWMLTLLAGATFCLYSTGSFAQDTAVYKKFRVDVGAGIPFKAGEKLDGLQDVAMSGYIEPNYAINDHVAIGLRYANAYAYTFDGYQVSSKNNCLYMAMLHYRSNTLPNNGKRVHNNRFTARLGLGLNNYVNRIDTTSFLFPRYGKGKTAATSFAFTPAVGFETGKLVFEFIYFYSGNKGANFPGIGAGFYFGGGRKDR